MSSDLAEDVTILSSRSLSGRVGAFRLLGRLLERKIDRLALLFLGLSSAAASLAEGLVLIAISVGGLRLSQDQATPVNLPFGLPLDAMETSTLVVAGLGLLALRLLILLGNSYAAARLSESVLYRWRARLFHSYQASSWERQSALDEGYLQTLTQTYVNRVAATLQQLTRAITAGTSFVTFVVGAFVISPLAALVLAGFGGALFASLRPATRAIRHFAAQQKVASREYARLLAESSSLSLEHRVFGVEQAVERRLDDQLHTLARSKVRQLTLQLFTPNLYVGIGYSVILIGLLVAVQLGTAEVATLGAIVLLMLRSLGYGQTLQTTSQAVASSEPFLRDFFEGISVFETSAEPHGDLDPGVLHKITVTDAAFERGDKTVLPRASLEIEAGEAIGIVGPSGGGKSTLALALLRLLEPTSGRFAINDTPAQECSAEWWRTNIAFVPQEPHLFDGTLFENIAMHRPEITRERAALAATDAHLSVEIATWDAGIDHLLGSKGRNLSGGQRQRICIARALAGNPALLILDEPTSSLDKEAEESITDVLAQLSGSRTLVVIAHRLSTLQFCDRIVRVENGALTEIGWGSDLLDGVSGKHS